MNVQTIDDVIESMRLLHVALPQLGLTNARAFNTTYLIITEAVFQKLNRGYFEHPELLCRLDLVFFEYYYKSLFSYVNKKKVPGAWQKMFDYSKSEKSLQFVNMALGVNAHVNNDLPQALVDSGATGIFKDDFNKVNNIIREQLDLVVRSLREKSYVLDTVKNNFPFVYSSILNNLIIHWRFNAFRNFIKLKKGEITVGQIEAEAEAVAAKLTEIKKAADISKLNRVILTV